MILLGVIVVDEFVAILFAVDDNADDDADDDVDNVVVGNFVIDTTKS